MMKLNLLRNARTLMKHPDYLGQYSRYQWQRLRGGPDGATIRMPWGDKVGGFVNFSEYRSAPHCLDAREIAFLARLARLMRSRSALGRVPYVLDVGANLGVTALYLAHLFPENSLVCFEPAPTTFAALAANMARNHYPNIRCENLAVSGSVGDVLFDAQPRSRANARISSNGADGIRVAATTLDNYCAVHHIDRVALLKIDTEGHEHAVLNGTHNMLKYQSIEVVYYEFCPELERQAGVEIGTAVKTLEESGYFSFTINERGYLDPFSLNMNQIPDLCNLIAVGPMLQECMGGLVSRH